MADEEAPKKEDDRSRKTSSSLVTDVLLKTGRLEKEDINSCVKKISQKADEVKAEVLQAIYNEYTFDEFLDFSNSTFELNWSVNNLITEIEAVSGKLKNSVEGSLDAAASEHSELVRQLKETEAIAESLKRLYKIHKALDAFSGELNQAAYYNAAKLVQLVKELLLDLPKAGQEGRIFVALREEWRNQKAQLAATLEKAWAKRVSWTVPDTASLDNRQGHLKTQLRLVSGDCTISDLMKAMEELGILDKRLRTFGKKLVHFIFRPLTLFPSLTPQFGPPKKDITIISLVKESGKKIIDPGVLYTKVLEVLCVIRNFFEGKRQEEDEKSLRADVASLSVMSKLGECVWPDLSETIITECLKRSIPNTSAQLEKYQVVINDTEEFEKKVISLGLVSEGTTILSSYAKDVGIHFGNKKCQDLLVAARDLMKDDIHNTVQVDSQVDKAVLVSLGDVQKAVLQDKKGSKNEPLQADEPKTLSKFTFHLPTCRISESTKKLMDLAYKTLIEATESTPQCAVQLFYTVRNMFELYCNVVPTYHKQHLAKLPQLSALHHNNCMYIAHHLLTLGHQFRPSLPEPLNQSTASFVDLVPTVRQMGEHCFLEQLKKQRSNLLEVVKATKDFANVDEDSKGLQVEKALKQVLHLLTNLGKVWSGILPEDIYCQSLGALFDDVLQNITWEVLQLEDISAEEAHQLHSLLSLLVQRGSEIFKNTKSDNQSTESNWDICAVVPHWTRFKELIGILEATLQDIVGRWEDGKGPLAHEFSAPEIRGLVRALFQNTDRRAAVVAKIKPVQ